MKLSVAMLTYNHEKYIEQALDSVLMQEVNFDYEIVIGDDLSQDRTREILLKYQEHHPDKIQLLLYEEKRGVGGNSYEVLTKCKGEYIALLEGDDYWTSPAKLQTQVDFLDTHPDYSLCFHPISRYSQEQGEFGTEAYEPMNTLRTWMLIDVLIGKIFPKTASIIYRNELFTLPTWIPEVTNVDTVLIVLCGHHGLLGDIGNTAMSVYRHHNKGIWTGGERIWRLESNIKTANLLNSHLYYKYHKYFRIRQSYLLLLIYNYDIKNYKESHKVFSKAFTIKHAGQVDIIMLIKCTVLVTFPSLFRYLKRIKNMIRTPY